MVRKTILFDLDGTLTDSAEGIINCSTLALEHFGLPIPDRETMRVFVGPPLHDTFVKFGVPEDKADEAVAVFRSRYFTVGKFENAPYPGIHELLETLKSHGHTLLIATSKPETLAFEVTKHFGLYDYFDRICGATLDRSRVNKDDVIAYLLNQYQDDKERVMVGDTAFDVTGAAVHNIPTIGVSWGYGTAQEMLDAGAIAIAEDMQHLLQLLEA